MPSSPHRRLYPDQSRGSPPSSPLAQRSITRPSPMRRDASTSVPDGTINPFMGSWEATNSPSASSQSSQRGGHIEYYAGAPLRPGPVTASTPESDDVEGNDDVDAPDLKSSEEVKSPSTKILIFHMSLTMTWDNNSSNNFAQIVYDNLGVLDAVWIFIHTADFYLLETFWDVAMMLVEVCEADAEGLVVALWSQALEMEVDKAEDEDRNDDMEWRELSRKRKRRFISNGNCLLDANDTRIGREDLPRATMGDLEEAWKYGKEFFCPRMP
ncbi:hypothetical protein I352_03793 [Cryptococcus deuterogattii MMRL2647]|nr:hypothetical protein I352_03793 [Cryptococcus deuterogattii MMRL2647]